MPVATSELVSIDTAVSPGNIWRLTVAQYHDMIERGILQEGAPIELLDGWLVQKMVHNPPHRLAIGLVHDALEQVVPGAWHLDFQSPITLSTSEPEPDAVVVRGARREYRDRHPGPGELSLVIEIADTSLEYDQTYKKAVYAHAGISTYWILNLVDRRLQVYTQPTGPAARPDYRQRKDYVSGEEAPVVLDGRDIARVPVQDLLP